MPELIHVQLSADEMARRRALAEATACFANARVPVRLFVDSPFYCKASGIPIEAIYDEPAAMMRAQLYGWQYVLEHVACDVPSIEASLDFGSFLSASTYGCRVMPQPGSVPGFDPWFTGTAADMARLEAIDVRATGYWPVAVRFYEACMAIADDFVVQYGDSAPEYPVRRVRLHTSSEGPFSIACMIAGFDRVSMWCYDEPEMLDDLLDLLTDKEITRIHHAFEVMGETPSAIGMADDYSPYLSVEMFERFVLPRQLRLRDAFGEHLGFHSCICDRRLLAHWRDTLRITVYNGGKPSDGFGTLVKDYTPVKEAMAGKLLLEPDLDGANLMCATENELRAAIDDFLTVFDDPRGISLCATICGGHRVDDLAKLNVMHDTVLKRTCVSQ